MVNAQWAIPESHDRTLRLRTHTAERDRDRRERSPDTHDTRIPISLSAQDSYLCRCHKTEIGNGITNHTSQYNREPTRREQPHEHRPPPSCASCTPAAAWLLPRTTLTGVESTTYLQYHLRDERRHTRRLSRVSRLVSRVSRLATLASLLHSGSTSLRLCRRLCSTQISTGAARCFTRCSLGSRRPKRRRAEASWSDSVAL